jgi:hypothetical protein
MKISTASLAVLVLATPAYASKYNCEFQKDGTAVHACTIDSAGSSSCTYAVSSNLSGVCAVISNGLDLLICGFGTPAAASASLVSGLPRDNARNAARALAQKPGFFAGGLTLSQPGAGIVAGLYRESQSAPSFAGVCAP